MTETTPTADAPAPVETIELRPPFQRLSWTDCVACGLSLGVVAALSFVAGVRSVDVTPRVVLKPEFMTQQVWAPQCAPNFRGATVREMPAPPLFDDYATATDGDGRETVRHTPRYDGPGKPSAYDRAVMAAERKYYRDLLTPPKKGR